MAVFAYSLRRILALIPTLIVISAITFFLGNFAPGDPIQIMLGEKGTQAAIDRIKHQYGLDRPALVQYGRFLWKAVRGDLGLSYAYPGRSVSEMVKKSFAVSVKLGTLAMLYAGVFGVVLGVVAAVNRGGPLDLATMFLAVVGISVPNFIMAICFMYLVGVQLHWLPVSGWGKPVYYIMPVFILGLRSLTLIARITRSSMLDVLNQDFVRTARAKGLTERSVVYKHAVRNALVPVVTVLGTTLGGLITGTYIIEFMYSIPGLGQVALQAINQRDYPVIQITTLLIAIVFVAVNLVVDLTYGVIDPRIRYS